MVSCDWSSDVCSSDLLEHVGERAGAFIAQCKRHIDNLLPHGHALNRRFDARPLYAPSGTAQSALEHEINSTWFPFIQAEFDKGNVEQAKIYTPQEYARLADTCNGEIRDIVNRRRRK